MIDQQRIQEIRKYMADLSRDCNRDIEQNHLDADGMLCEILIMHGYDDIVKHFDYLDKWYA